MINDEYNFEIAINNYLNAITFDNIEDTIETFLEILGKYYGAEKTYLFQVSSATKEIKNNYFWANSEETAKASNLKNFKIDNELTDVLNYLNSDDDERISEIDINNFNEGDIEYKFLTKYNLKNLVAHSILSLHNEVVGFIGMSNRDTSLKLDKRVMLAITKYTEQNLKNIVTINSLISTSETDQLTGFYSRRKYSIDVDRLVEENHKSIGIVFVNLNGLKKINDNLGYSAGDEFIKKSANVLKNNINGNIYRISGDEFVIIFQDVSEEEVIENAESLRNAKVILGENIYAVGHSYKTGGRINILRLVSDADNIMYINKQKYYHQIHNETNQNVSNELLNDLMFAVDNEEFLVYLQPKVNLIDASIVGAEALVRRFNTVENKMIFPDQFIPLYEKNSIIRHVDICVLTTVCKLLSGWEKYNKQFPISVNLSRVTLMEDDIVETISNICDKFGVDHKYIVIEITERIGLVENNIASKLISDFKEKGFSLSLDDFGCAYSNIVTLAKIDVDEVKIDKSLIDDIIENPKNRIIVENVLNMCSSFVDTYAVAEGIEITEQADILMKFGCLYGQGYHYSRPIPNEEFFKKYIEEA